LRTAKIRTSRALKSFKKRAPERYFLPFFPFFPQKPIFGTILRICVAEYQLKTFNKLNNMKKTAFLAGMILLFAAVNAQDTTKPAVETKPAVSNPTVDSIAAKYKLQPMPEALAIEQVFPVIGEYQATAATTSTEAAPSEPAAAKTEAAAPVTVSNLKVMLDEQNKGLIWIEGLPQGKVKGMLRKSPATYKIPAQKTEEGNEVKEGTLIYDKDTKTISVIIGKAYNDQDPAASFMPATTEEPVAEAPKAKSKKAVAKKKAKPVEKPWVFVGTKVEHTTAASN
jgi:hypothetical protein